MKHLFFTMIFATATIVSTLSSCSKDGDTFHNSSTGTSEPPPPVISTVHTLNLTASNWEGTGGGVAVHTFANVLVSSMKLRSVDVYLVTIGTDTLINKPIRFMGGELWATYTQTDVKIHLRNARVPYLNIKVVIEYSE